MEDREIVNLYWERNSNAIKETASKYGGYCKAIAKNILGNNEDAEECANDTYLNTWNSIPPNRPNVLSTYLGKITRNLSFDRFRHRHADKRGGGEIELVLDELGECVSGADSVEQEVEKKETAYLGKIESEISNSYGVSDGIPKENFQANHSIVGSEVYRYGDDILIEINGKYWLYEKFSEGAN